LDDASSGRAITSTMRARSSSSVRGAAAAGVGTGVGAGVGVCAGSTPGRATGMSGGACVGAGRAGTREGVGVGVGVCAGRPVTTRRSRCVACALRVWTGAAQESKATSSSHEAQTRARVFVWTLLKVIVNVSCFR
jgi:hypothetical protein